MLNLSAVDCQGQIGCGQTHRGSGIVFLSAEPLADDVAESEDERVVYLDFETEAGALAVLEIASGQGRPRIRYREVRDGALFFKGVVVEQNVSIRTLGDSGLAVGSFAFRAVDARAREAQPQPVRIVSFGSLAPGGEEAAVIDPGPALPVPSPPSQPDPGPQPEPAPPRPRAPPPPDPAPDPDVAVRVLVHDSGCTDTGSGGGCDDPPDSSDGGGDCGGGNPGGGGCEGDSVDAGGCDGADAASGCEGDAAASGCDGCSTTGQAQARAARSIWRLSWPLILIALTNRRWRKDLRRRSRYRCGPPSSR